MTDSGKPGKPKAGFPPFPPSLESPQKQRASHIPTASTTSPYLKERLSRAGLTAGPKTVISGGGPQQTAEVGQNHLPNAPPHKKRGETLQRAAAGVPRNGVPRQPSHTLHWNRRPKRSSGEAHSTRLSKPKHGPQKATDFGYRTVHEATDKAKPSFRLFHADRMRRA
jgi:hypothetical protein